MCGRFTQQRPTSEIAAIFEAEDLFDVRTALEPLAARLAARRTHPEGVERLRGVLALAREATDLGELDLPDRHDRHASVEARVDVHAALAQIPEGQRLALVLVDMHGLSVAEAAHVLGVAEGTVKSRCFRGREALGAILGVGARPVPGSTEPQGAP